jgi:UDP-N-acetylmuramoyl-tripeptide--D-alanyl-D-alanine ligase
VATPIPMNEARLDAWTAAAATGGRVVREAGRVAVFVTSDSRAVRPGCAFVALRGERVDGHDYLAQAIDAGACLVVTERGRSGDDPRADAVEVDDTLVAWGLAARAHLRAWRRARKGDARVLAITGSAGKTTTKALAAALLGAAAESSGEVVATRGNLNNLVGLPATAWTVHDGVRFAVFEAGMSVPGEIARLAAVAEPDVAVIVNVGVAHAEGVGGTRGAVAREKGALYEALAPEGIAVVNADDAAARGQLARTVARRAVFFGRSADADYRLLSRTPEGTRGSTLEVARAGDRLRVSLPLVGEAAAIDVCAALAACDAMTGRLLPQDAIARGLAMVDTSGGRAEATELSGGVLLVDDSYNANPESMRAALATLAELATGRRAVAVLGEMLELGPLAELEHDALGDRAADAGVALVVTCGGLASRTAARARARGVEVIEASSSKDAAARAASAIGPGDVVLVKGSRGARTELVARAIRERFSDGGAGAP